MTVLELNAKKAELIKSILNDVDSEDILNQVADVVKRLTTKKFPCMYTPEEISAGADRVLTARRSGDRLRFVPFEEVKKKRTV